MKDVPVVIGGGGPAGLASAIGFARQGLRVIVVERRAYPVDKACGEGIQPPGIAALRRLGVLDRIPAHARKEFRGIAYFTGEDHAEAEFAEGPGMGIRRMALSQALRDSAIEHGVILVRGNLRDVLPDYSTYVRTGLLPALGVRAKLVVGADGLNSVVRAWAGLDRPGAPVRRFGIRRHFTVPGGHIPEFVQVHTGNLCEAYITPTGGNEIQIAFLWHKEKFPGNVSHNVFEQLLSEFPVLRPLTLRPASRLMGTGRLFQRSRNVASRGVILIGDAAGYLDALTGEGLSLAFEEASAAEGLAKELNLEQAPLSFARLKGYSQAYRRITANYRLTTIFLLRLSKHPRLVRGVIRFLSARPAWMQVLLSLNMGTRRPASALFALAGSIWTGVPGRRRG